MNFAARVLAAPNSYGLVAGDATQIDDAAQDFATKHSAVTAPLTRTKASITSKDNAKTQLVAILRGYAMQIKNNRAVSNADKINLGIGVYDGNKAPVPVPATFPLLNLVAAIPLQHELRFSDSDTPDRSAKPAGAIGMQLVCHIGTTAPAPEDRLASPLQYFITRQPVKISFQPADLGKTAYYFARWQTARGLYSPWSQMVSMTIGG